MKQVTFWFDVISPYAYLAFERLPRELEGLSYCVSYKPLLFAGLLTHWGQKGPAEIEPKRAWTYRQVQWVAKSQALTLDLPAQHPFNPLAVLRLLVAAGANRRTVELAMRHVWHGGHDANDPARLQALESALGCQRDPSSTSVKDELRALTQEALQQQVFGVPTLQCEGQSFFGQDALPMLAAAMRGEAWFAPGGGWYTAAAPRQGVVR